MANNIERLGVSFCDTVANQNGWIFREQPICDIGIDAHMEFNDTDGKTQRLLAIQIKSGESFFREKKDGNIIFRGINDRQYNYWTTYPLPCIIVLYNPNDNTCIWQKLTNKTIVKTNNGYCIAVPEKQVFLDDFSNDILKKYINLPNYITNYNFLLSQKIFMEIIESGGIVKLHAEDLINKTLGVRKVDLIVDDGEGEKTYSYPYYFPYDSGEVVFQRLFPWADFSIDEEYYENSDYEQWLESENYYDDEEGKYFVIGDSFEEYRSSLPPIRGIDHRGEVSEFMLIMRLNDLGKSFLTVDRYISDPQLYSDTKPQEIIAC